MGHGGVKADWGAVGEGVVWGAGDGGGEGEFAWDDFLGEVAFGDEVGDDEDDGGLDGAEGGAEVGFFFPEGDVDFFEDASAANFEGVEMGRECRFSILSGAVAEDEEGSIG